MIYSIQIITYSALTLAILVLMMMFFIVFPMAKISNKKEIAAWKTVFKGIAITARFLLIANIGLILYWIIEYFSSKSEGLNLGAILVNILAVLFFAMLSNRVKSSFIHKTVL